MATRRVHGVGVCVLAWLALIPGAAASALDFSAIASVYLESFDGEVGFPTTPELDTNGAGGSFSPFVRAIWVSEPAATAQLVSGVLVPLGMARRRARWREGSVLCPPVSRPYTRE